MTARQRLYDRARAVEPTVLRGRVLDHGAELRRRRGPALQLHRRARLGDVRSRLGAQRLDNFRTAPTHITYGKCPDTFEQRTLAPLQPNKTYAVLVGGPGEMTGRLEFHVDASGAVRD